MAVFTTDQANACTIIRCDSFKQDGVHIHFVFAVTDDNDKRYEWQDESLASDANHDTIKAAIHDYLITQEKILPGPVKSHVSDDTIIGELVGQTSP